jgi:hypothetical protein
MDSRPATISLALIVFICFFLPWVEVSCGKSESRLSGVDLARDGHRELWLIPILMVAMLAIATARAWHEKRQISALIGLVTGLVTAFLMNRERVRTEDSSGLVAVGLTVWFWLGIGATIGLSILSSFRFLKRPQPS